ncbi:uncharacterized protein LOC134291087 [Aedes albopictus]|uniref:Integrase zinc-binding domain-containing protein n=1 Tax=Aedes albopictus TaxID=7160 RepID=A0ABM2A1T8_AEDAL
MDSNNDPKGNHNCDQRQRHSRKSNSTSSSNRSGNSQRQRLQLRLLEEERKLRLKHQEEEDAARKKAAEEEDQVRKKRMEEEQRYLKEKFELLMAGTEGSNDGSCSIRSDTSRKSDPNSRTSSQKVRDWLSRERDTHQSSGVNPTNQTFNGVQRSAVSKSAHENAPSNAVGIDAPSEVIKPVNSIRDCRNQKAVIRQAPPNSSTPQFSQEHISPSEALGQRTSISRIPMDISEYGPTAQRNANPAESQYYNRDQSSDNIQQVGPTPVQIAARQVMPRDLPKFSGDPEDWPMFFSAFQNTTTACGYSDVENLARLQRCLEGAALAAVKSRLLLPGSVPHVISTLQRLFGRPEIIIHSLLNKLRDVPAPKAENLKSVIEFGLAVQDLVDHMQLARLDEHLCNPMLLHELVERLPAVYKMQWSAYKRASPIVNLATFGTFMSDLVNTATDVTLPDLSASSSKSTRSMGPRNKSKIFVHTEETPEGEEETQRTSEESGKRCSYCSRADHEIQGCSRFKTLHNDDRWAVMRQNGLCRNCLIPHRKWPCRSGKVCGINGCRLRHHALLHAYDVEVLGAQARSVDNGSRNASIVHQNMHHVLPTILFRYLPVFIEDTNGKSVRTYAFLDDGSSSTLIEEGIAAELGINGPTDTLWLSWTGNVSREERGSKRVSIMISGRGMETRFQLNNVRTVQKLDLPHQTLQYDALKDAYPHLRGLPVASYSKATPGIIIGMEHARLLATLKIREGNADDPVAAKTRLGWCIYGKQFWSDKSVEHLNLHSSLGNRELHEQMKGFFGIEEATITVKPEADDDKRARQIMETTTRRVGKAFETGLLWRHEEVCFPDSYRMAEKRLVQLEKRLNRDPALKEKICCQIEEYERKGYAHRLTDEEIRSSDPKRIWYLPLGVVQNPKKPEKVRLIWDAAARSSGVSLNDMLLKGPDLLTSLISVLFRFRQRDIAICGDIREMFHQIIIRNLDKQAQRFLWRSSPDSSPQCYVMDVATFGATCSPSSAQFIKNKNAEEFVEQYPAATEAIIKGHYVDDYLDSVDTVMEAVQLWKDVRYVHAQGGFDMRNLISNSPEGMQLVGEKGSTATKSMNLDKPEESERVLGMVWKPKIDMFTYDTTLRPDIAKLIAEQSVPTKRQVLCTVMSLFDPLGLIANFVVQGKILMQDIWRSGTDWDEVIAENLHEKWIKWSNCLTEMGSVRIPRCFFSGASRSAMDGMQIHVFVDASPEAYASVAYLRIIDKGVPRCALVAAKSKVAPLKPLSVPRLELQAALIGSRLADTICKYLNLSVKQRFFWLDSSTVLAWLRSDSRRYHPFVAFRVGEILSLTAVNEWRHLQSKYNVADEATKWGSGPSFDPENRWFSGPPFLKKEEEYWPTQSASIEPVTEELRKVYVQHHLINQPLIDVTRFSKWQKLLRTTAFVLRAAKKFKKQQVPAWLSSEEYCKAENLLWRQVQTESYPEEYATLHHNMENPDQPRQLNRSSSLLQHSPYLDDAGIMRMDSRITAAPNTFFNARHPIILPKNHRLTYLLVDSFHCRFLHGNSETILNEIRQRFSISTLRSLVKRVSKDCQICRIRKATPQPPKMAPLPVERLMSFIRPFTNTGIDYFGPVTVKIGRSNVKRWVVLFTCLSVCGSPRCT